MAYVKSLLIYTISIYILIENVYSKGPLCPHLYKKTFHGFVPQGNLTAGNFNEIQDSTNLETCISKCCLKPECNVVFHVGNKCYHITCMSNELCTPIPSKKANSSKISMVLIKPVFGEESWLEVIENLPDIKSDQTNEDLSIFNSYVSNSQNCNLLTDSCPHNEECIASYFDSPTGLCQCKSNYMRDDDGKCINYLEESQTENTSTAITKKPLIIVIESKEVKLPINQVTLIAYVTPEAPKDVKYQYDWTLLQQPTGSTATKDQNGEKLQLSRLSEGLYTFKVSVTSEDAYGETYANVTVLPPSRINKPPQIIITPVNQTVKLPNTGAVLDASSSMDDDGIVSWHWELQQAPLGYQPVLTDTSTLQLHDLTRPGNYTFKLTVTDTDKATNSSTANITVLKLTDYPPEANAGQDVIVYLPHNQVTLSGNLSSDDHAITTWEWTKSAGDENKAVDMQDSHSPYLHLTDLEEGIYTFILKVTDSANQSSNAEVHVFVKPPTNQPPIANAGDNTTISLPQTWFLLNANNSKDDNGITSFLWEQIDGPTNAIFTNNSIAISNVTNLSKGLYNFRVTVTDDSKNSANSNVYITVDQNKNQKPVANAGGDFEVELPSNAIYINGSKSHDDWKVVKWNWKSTDNSLAIGNIAEGSDQQSILILTNPIVGKYIFNLTVFDEQGLSDCDSVTITIKNDPKLYYMVQITIAIGGSHLTQSQYEIVKGKLGLFVKDGAKLKVRNVKADGLDRSIITFYVENMNGKPIDANEVVGEMRHKLKMDVGLLGFTVISLETSICQNNCSGHGVCDEKTRKCICEAFWMPNLFKVYFSPDEDSDCKWSILYVILGVICSLVALIGSFWGCIYLCCVWCANRKNLKPNNYKLIENSDDSPNIKKGPISDSDTDSDVVYFESRNKSKQKPLKNGLARTNRRIKT